MLEKYSPFSVLMSVYIKEEAQYFDECMHSLSTQTVHCDEIVLVEDGPITQRLRKTIENWSEKMPIRTIRLEKNQGLGVALNLGVVNCKNEMIARMDADDIAYPERFAKQLDYLQKNPDVSVVGSWIQEFSGSRQNIKGVRKLPIDFENLSRFAQRRSPLNHMTVMYRKSAVIKSGNYQTFYGFEDYDLWVRMLQAGFRIANLPECLVDARAGDDLIARRQGLTYAEREIYFQTNLLRKGFISFPIYLQNVVTRAGMRLLPKGVLGQAYRTVLRS